VMDAGSRALLERLREATSTVPPGGR
jgi:hypothetical protein